MTGLFQKADPTLSHLRSNPVASHETTPTTDISMNPSTRPLWRIIIALLGASCAWSQETTSALPDLAIWAQRKATRTELFADIHSARIVLKK
jgi:hypothetical protein